MGIKINRDIKRLTEILKDFDQRIINLNIVIKIRSLKQWDEMAILISIIYISIILNRL